ncbi:phosphoribosylaminoimidazolesuccinocarboxamide synthase [Wenzhouxiangella sp. AB-CW3]|nr:phosphoribosylaminoimidazolesuccinocarboxamide synthase [Wenzhouxiangella sp. AB-CW3]
MDPVGAGGQHGVDFFAQAGKIGRKNGRGNDQRLLHDSIHTRIIRGWPILYPPAVSHYPIPPLQLLHQGKVRDIYVVDDERLLIVASDRLSAFDVILPDPIPGKGELLTRISNFWLSQFDDQVANHLLDGDLAEILGDADMARQLEPRSMLVRRLKPLPVEAIVRGYVAGSGWKDYQATGAISGIALPEGLEQAAPLPDPIFTPSTKAAAGEHDENIDFAAMQALIGPELALRVRDISLAIYRRAAAYARNRGIIIADTKFEFGTDSAGELYLIDEVLTPDSSRFWPVDQWRLGISPPSFDKQFVRDYLETLDWDKTPPGPELPGEIIDQTRQRYQEAADRLIS